MRGKDLWCEETKTTVKIMGHSRSTTTLLRCDVYDFQLSDKALDLVKDPNGGNATISPLEGWLSWGRAAGRSHRVPAESPAEKSLVYRFQLSSAALLRHVVVDRDWFHLRRVRFLRPSSARWREMSGCRRRI